MRKLLLLLSLIFFTNNVYAEVPNIVGIDDAEKVFLEISENVDILNEIVSSNQNFKNITEENILKLDKNYETNEQLKNRLLTNVVGKKLESLENQYESIVEIFVVNNVGLNVGMSHPTSDYWQGDEEKFTETFGSENNIDAVHVSQVEYDNSSQSFSYQYSRTISRSGLALGAVTIVISVTNALER